MKKFKAIKRLTLTSIIMTFLLTFSTNADSVSYNHAPLPLMDELGYPLEVNRERTFLDSLREANFGIERHISVEGENLIKSEEGCKLTAYRCSAGFLTIGWGHQITPKDRKGWLKGRDRISKKEADVQFTKDIRNYIDPAVNRLLDELDRNGVETWKFGQEFIDGFGSLVYNCGEGGVHGTLFYKTLRKGEIEKAVAMVPRTKVSKKGHKPRRIKEMNLMQEGIRAFLM